MNEFLKKHADTITIVLTFLGCFWHLNERISTIEKDVSAIKTEIAVLKAVMIMQKLMPAELAHKEEKMITSS